VKIVSLRACQSLKAKSFGRKLDGAYLTVTARIRKADRAKCDSPIAALTKSESLRRSRFARRKGRLSGDPIETAQETSGSKYSSTLSFFRMLLVGGDTAQKSLIFDTVETKTSLIESRDTLGGAT
jgi:hypothetical protein